MVAPALYLQMAVNLHRMQPTNFSSISFNTEFLLASQSRRDHQLNPQLRRCLFLGTDILCQANRTAWQNTCLVMSEACFVGVKMVAWQKHVNEAQITSVPPSKATP
jgi:hypothetical protein